jgi:Kef-type K+ transport system membrane component KefB
VLGALSQVGLVLFLYLVGLEVSLEHLRKESRLAIVTSGASILVPLLAGMAIAILLYPKFSGPPVKIWLFALFLGVAMSITAFPVLARILTERKMLGTRLGRIAIACAAAADAAAWVLLAILVALSRATGLSGLWKTGVGLAVLLALLFGVVRPLAQARLKRDGTSKELPVAAMAIAIAGAFLCSATTEWLGLHALFGAFVWGLASPRDGRLQQAMLVRVEHITTTLLLPPFFVMAGLRTNIGLLQDPVLWGYGALVLLTAVAGKWGGAALAARWIGMESREAMALGILMNTRGLVELVALNIGYELGILSPALFSIFVLMALATTMMAVPALTLLERKPRTALQRASA